MCWQDVSETGFQDWKMATFVSWQLHGSAETAGYCNDINSVESMSSCGKCSDMAFLPVEFTAPNILPFSVCFWFRLPSPALAIAACSFLLRKGRKTQAFWGGFDWEGGAFSQKCQMHHHNVTLDLWAKEWWSMFRPWFMCRLPYLHICLELINSHSFCLVSQHLNYLHFVIPQSTIMLMLESTFGNVYALL